MTVQSYLHVVKSGAVEVWREARANIAAVLHLCEMRPQDWRRYANGLVDMRESIAKQYPAHNTAPCLRKVIAAGTESSRPSKASSTSPLSCGECAPASFGDAPEHAAAQ